MDTALSSSTWVEIIPNRLYWVSDKRPPLDQPNEICFNIDKELVYNPIKSDFGPLDLGKTYRYVTELEELLNNPAYSKSKIFHHTSREAAKRANAACLMGCYQVLVLGKTADEAWEPFSKVQPSLAEYRDPASDSPYRVKILDVLRGLEYAVKLGWFDLKTFNLQEYEFNSRKENGGWNWIVPGKFLAFGGPSAKGKDFDGTKRWTPEDYVPVFQKHEVSLVARLGDKLYDTDRFTKHGINHRDFYFFDGSNPKDALLGRFLECCENEKGVIAVHCNAGLGRTGTMIACFLMKHYKFPAADLIGWLRLARPGSVLGQQQQFLVDKEPSIHELCESSPIFQTIAPVVQDLYNSREVFLRKQLEKLQVSQDESEEEEEEKSQKTKSVRFVDLDPTKGLGTSKLSRRKN